MCGGLTEARVVAEMATAENVAVSTHCWMGGVGLAANLHFAATLPTYPHAENEPEPPLFEVDRAEKPLGEGLIDGTLDLTGGRYRYPGGRGSASASTRTRSNSIGSAGRDTRQRDSTAWHSRETSSPTASYVSTGHRPVSVRHSNPSSVTSHVFSLLAP